MNHVIISLCENDDHGIPRGDVSAVHFTNALNYDTPPVLELESPYVNDDYEPEGPKCERRGHAIVIDGDWFPIRDFRAHVGNLSWNGYVVSLDMARLLAKVLVEKHEFSIDAETYGQPFLITEHTKRLA